MPLNCTLKVVNMVNFMYIFPQKKKVEKVVSTAQRKLVFGPAGPEAAGSSPLLHLSLHFSLLSASTFLPGPALHHLRGWVHLGFSPALLLTSHEMLESSPKGRPGIIKVVLSLCLFPT